MKVSKIVFFFISKKEALLSMHVNAFKDIEVQIHMHDIKTSKQVSISEIFQRVDDV